jgi:hypothetical protein
MFKLFKQFGAITWASFVFLFTLITFGINRKMKKKNR